MRLKNSWYKLPGVVLLLLAFGGVGMARTVLDLDTARQPVALSDWGDYWIDPGGQTSVEQVGSQAGASWQPTLRRDLYGLRAGQTLWIRFTIPPAPDSERWYLEAPYPAVKRVSLYSWDGISQWSEQRAGDSVAVSHWPVPHRHPLLPVAVSAEAPHTYLLRIENSNGFSAPLRFVSESQLGRSEQRISLILGIYFGLAGLAIMIAVLSALSLRDTAYALYAPCVALMALTQASITGIAGLHLWPHWPWWNDVSTGLLPPLTAACMLLFVAAAVSMAERSRRFHLLLLALASLGALVAAACLVVPPSWRLSITLPLIAVAELVLLYALFWAWRHGDRHAIWMLLGLLPGVLMALFPLLRSSGLLGQSFLTQHGTQFGHALELPVLLVVLMLRSQQRRENRRRLRGLDRIDPATGLINEQVFAERLRRLLARSLRLRHQGAVVLIDLVNTEALQRDFGGKSAQELPLRVASRLLSTAREIDSVARLSEHRFGMLVEGPLTPDEAQAVGPRIVARCLMPFDDKPADWVAQLRVAMALVPLDGSHANTLLNKLSTVLSTVPADSKRAVFSLHD